MRCLVNFNDRDTPVLHVILLCTLLEKEMVPLAWTFLLVVNGFRVFLQQPNTINSWPSYLFLQPLAILPRMQLLPRATSAAITQQEMERRTGGKLILIDLLPWKMASSGAAESAR